MDPLPASVLPDGVTARIVDNVGDLDIHILEAGLAGQPAIFLLHGFPELAFCWRRLMPILAADGFHVIAPDQRGFGRTTPQSGSYPCNLEPYATRNLARDIANLADAFDLTSVAAIVGHDCGAIVAGYCALSRPDLFHMLILSASPFGGAPIKRDAAQQPFIAHPIHDELAHLVPPKKHYQVYYTGPQANRDMWHCPQGMHRFLRGYYHQKSADWSGNAPRPLAGWTAAEIAAMPSYYCMPADLDMAAVADAIMPSDIDIAACEWLPDADLSVAAAEFERTGFQPALNWYRSAVAEGMTARDLAQFAGLRVTVPTFFIAGAADWGPYQAPGLLEQMQYGLADAPVATRFIEGAGHWVQQEQPVAFAEVILEALRSAELAAVARGAGAQTECRV